MSLLYILNILEERWQECPPISGRSLKSRMLSLKLLVYAPVNFFSKGKWLSVAFYCYDCQWHFMSMHVSLCFLVVVPSPKNGKITGHYSSNNGLILSSSLSSSSLSPHIFVCLTFTFVEDLILHCNELIVLVLCITWRWLCASQPNSLVKWSLWKATNFQIYHRMEKLTTMSLLPWWGKATRTS